ncbi:MAG: TonB-dependent receptor [Flavobacteriaceae bacterium]|nr:TonB-dependent receptor [Flavobacteriaceae bacterium]
MELWGQFKNENYQFGASFFYSYLEDFISAIVDPDLPRKFMPTMEPKFAKRFINLDKAYQTGFEAFFNYYLTAQLILETDISYTYGQNEDFDEPLPQVTPLTGHIGIKYDQKKYWVNLKSRLVDSQDRVAVSFGEEETPGFATFDISAGFVPFKGLSIGAAILNIFDKAYYEHLNFAYNGADLLSGRIYEPGRNFTFYATYNFQYL